MKVMKFGGGCLKNYEHLLKIAEIIKAEEDFPVVIVSAISGITNHLEKGIQMARESKKRASEIIPEIIKDIRDKHEYICEASIKNDDIKHRTMDEIESRLKKLGRLFYGIAYTEEVTKSLKALILSYGERLSVFVLSGILKSQGKDSNALETDRIGLITDESFENATAILNEVSRNLKAIVLNFPHLSGHTEKVDIRSNLEVCYERKGRS